MSESAPPLSGVGQSPTETSTATGAATNAGSQIGKAAIPVPEKLGTQATKDCLLFVTGIGSMLSSDLKDGHISFIEALGFISLATQVEVISKEIKSVPAELADLSADEASDLIKAVQTQIGGVLPNAKAIVVANAALKVIGPITDLVRAFKA